MHIKSVIYKICFLVCCLIIFACKKDRPKKAQSQVNFNELYSIDSKYNNKNNELNVIIHLKKGLHAYAEGEKVGKPIRLEILEKNGFKAAKSPNIPSGKVKNLKGLGKSYLHSGTIRVKQKLKGGKGSGKALLHLQVCTENMCDRPRKHEIVFNADQSK